jgi:pimeloyl-ACP methyl ester carboxylesterase
VPSTDGVVVALHELGGSGPPLLLAHATGFAGHVLAPLADELADQFRCYALDFRGHGDTRTPAGIDFRWTGLADDVVAAIGHADLAPVFAFGHSSGGAAVLMAAARGPELLRAVYCFEPILWPDPGAARERAEGLAAGARRRRAGFATREEAYANYKSKPPFAWFDDAALRAYVDHGLEDQDGGTVALKCPPEVEAEIYLAGAANEAFEDLSRVTCPTVIARGTERGAIGREIAEAQAAAIPGARVEDFDGLSHFGPMEDPARVAEALSRAFQ